MSLPNTPEEGNHTMERKGIRTWMKQFMANGSFEDYYAQLIAKGGEGLPTAREARQDLEQTRRRSATWFVA
jgi:hypothetical protein